MNDYAAGEMIKTVFLGSFPAVVGIVLAITLLLFVIVAFRDGLLKEVQP